MKSVATISFTIAMALFGSSAMAKYDDDNYRERDVYSQSHSNVRFDRATVVRVVPIYNRREDQQCRGQYDYRDYRNDHDDSVNGGAVVGALVGGALGNQVGKGDGRKASTVAGAVIGGLIGNQIARSDDRYDDRYDNDRDYNNRCRQQVNRADAYRVTYRYAGENYTTIMPYHPGNSVRVRVNVVLDDQRNISYRY